MTQQGHHKRRIHEVFSNEGKNAVDEGIACLRRALQLMEPVIDEALHKTLTHSLDEVEHRYAAGEPYILATLLGGTGSGKSTLFNALTTIEFADAGPLRPTTRTPTACQWGCQADELLDMVGVQESRRVRYDSELTIEDKWENFILIDMPDHDSIEVSNGVQVDRIIPLSDLLIWVLDPQKYADHILHDDYLSAPRLMGKDMVVVLNQIDRVPQDQREDLVDDVRRLLEADGLEHPLFVVSAQTGEGLAELESYIGEYRNSGAGAVSTALASLEHIRQRLLGELAPSEADLQGEAWEHTVDSLCNACGLPAVVESIRYAGSHLHKVALTRPEQPAPTLVAATRDAWSAYVCQGLPVHWRCLLEGKFPRVEQIRHEVAVAARFPELPAPARGMMITACVVASLIFVVGISAAVYSAMNFAGVGMLWAIGILTLAGVLGGVLISGARRLCHIRTGREVARYRQLIIDGVAEAAHRTLREPAAQVLDVHRRVREEVARGQWS